MRRTIEAAPSMRGVGVVSENIADAPVRKSWSIPRPRRRFDRLELLLFAAFAVVSVWVIALDLWQVIVHGRTWTGTDGVYITDQMQYLSWVVSASHSGLVANLFVTRPSSAVYLQPAILISGLLTAFGLPPTVALLIWKPVAVCAFFFAARAMTGRVLRGRGRDARLAALTLALFYGCLSIVYGQLSVVGDLFPGFLSWGYPFTLLAVAATIYALLTYERARTDQRLRIAPGMLAALAGALHPWQGELFVLVLVGGELIGGGIRWGNLREELRSPRLRLASVTLGLALLPLIYYYALGKFNIDWQLGQAASKHNFPASAIAIALGPLALVALLGLRGPAGGFLGRATRLWPLAAVLIYLQALTSEGAAPLHAFDGVTLPLALLAVKGYARLQDEPGPLRRLWPRSKRIRWTIIGVAVTLGTIPATYDEMREALVEVKPTSGNGNFIQPDEKSALAYLKHDHDPGAVISSAYLGMLVPGYTGRRTYDGDCVWSQPRCGSRDASTQSLLGGRLTRAAAQQVVSSSHARFVLLACSSATAKVEAQLRPLTSSVTEFGCASVIELRTG
ncbi:MAG TPA: hypothetical protein VMD48_11470 [Solirubrobacteraceae bacterium]|nr:hypothetical protein [Solirubrobacteraceae bacterium]